MLGNVTEQAPAADRDTYWIQLAGNLPFGILDLAHNTIGSQGWRRGSRSARPTPTFPRWKSTRGPSFTSKSREKGNYSRKGFTESSCRSLTRIVSLLLPVGGSDITSGQEARGVGEVWEKRLQGTISEGQHICVTRQRPFVPVVFLFYFCW